MAYIKLITSDNKNFITSSNKTFYVRQAVSVDLTTLSGWSQVSAGQHVLTVVAKANGYKNSNPSAGVTFVKQNS